MAFGGGLEDSENEVMSDINMTPLVDVVLVLLIIFIITVPVLTHSVKLDLPREQNQPNIVKPQTVMVSITADGAYHWGDSEISLSELEERLASAVKQDPQPEIHIRGDAKTDYEHVMRVTAMAQRSGILKLGFVTDPR